MRNSTPLFQKIYDLYKYYYQIIDHFPKKSRVVLSVKIEERLIELLEISSKLEFSSKDSKEMYLKEASTKTDILKILFRFCYDTRIIDQKRYLLIEGSLVEIGRMIGGWLKNTNRT